MNIRIHNSVEKQSRYYSLILNNSPYTDESPDDLRASSYMYDQEHYGYFQKEKQSKELDNTYESAKSAWS